MAISPAVLTMRMSTSSLSTAWPNTHVLVFCLFACLLIDCQPTCLPVSQSVGQSVSQSVYLPACLSIYLLINVSVLMCWLQECPQSLVSAVFPEAGACVSATMYVRVSHVRGARATRAAQADAQADAKLHVRAFVGVFVGQGPVQRQATRGYSKLVGLKARTCLPAQEHHNVDAISA